MKLISRTKAHERFSYLTNQFMRSVQEAGVVEHASDIEEDMELNR
jgi:hypothetical protein